MGRQLRSRASRPNYATLIHFDDDGAGPSNASAPIFEEGDSGSDFAPEDAREHAAEEDDEMDDDVVEEDEDAPGDGGRLSDSDIEGSVVVLSTPGPQRKKTNAKVKNVSGVPGIVTSSRQNYVLPSLHHRHRAIPLYDRGGPVERLLQPPAPFRPATVSLTNNWSFTPISDRVGKSWGHNVGPGPLWELMEDRGWFKESMTTDGEVSADERCRRPRVHAGVTVQGCRILTPEDAMPYLPTGLDAQENGEYKAPPPVPCSFGPYEKQTRVMMKMFEARRIEEFIPKSKSHVFNPGAPVWGLSWCPIHPDDRPRHGHKQYLAVAPFPSSEYSPSIGVRIQRPASACIQIWSLGPSHDAMEVDGNGGNDPGEMRCELVLCVESGPAFELRWCPLPANDPAPADGSNLIPRKLGILAGTFEDGSFSLYAVPDPASLAASLGDNHDPSQPIFVSMTQPLLRIEFEETMCWGFDWANSEVIAVGCTNGSIAVYDIGEVLRTGQCDARHILPTHHFTVHQSAVRVLAWARTPVSSGSGERTADNPTIIASGGYDGLECLTDIREVSGSLLNRTRDVVNALCYSTYCGGPVTVDNENMIKTYSLSPSMLGRGHTIVEPEGPSWSVAASDYQPQLAIGVADGSCLTTNTLRATRRGGSVPFLVHKIYQLDYSRKDREWRMLEKFLPQEILDRTAATKANVDIPTGIGVWPREVAVQRVVWNDGNGLAGAPFLASATGSGLCRVDWLLGRWHRDRVPYYGIEGIRGEVGVQIDEAEESD